MAVAQEVLRANFAHDQDGLPPLSENIIHGGGSSCDFAFYFLCIYVSIFVSSPTTGHAQGGCGYRSGLLSALLQTALLGTDTRRDSIHVLDAVRARLRVQQKPKQLKWRLTAAQEMAVSQVAMYRAATARLTAAESRQWCWPRRADYLPCGPLTFVPRGGGEAWTRAIEWTQEGGAGLGHLNSRGGWFFENDEPAYLSPTRPYFPFCPFCGLSLDVVLCVAVLVALYCARVEISRSRYLKKSPARVGRPHRGAFFCFCFAWHPPISSSLGEATKWSPPLTSRCDGEAAQPPAPAQINTGCRAARGTGKRDGMGGVVSRISPFSAAATEDSTYRTALLVTTVSAALLAFVRLAWRPTSRPQESRAMTQLSAAADPNILPSPLRTFIPTLSAAELAALDYRPDEFPGARDVDTPVGSPSLVFSLFFI
ncbi:hypothetical protein VTK73DRAFT_4672 [Phialemonium thermophilum]|uniref:Transmembrane protein n=1 Tax=Phialemonium thermophilum TaxID=223376 RepID=A0ABR3V7F4_9PEZI